MHCALRWESPSGRESTERYGENAERIEGELPMLETGIEFQADKCAREQARTCRCRNDTSVSQGLMRSRQASVSVFAPP